MQAGSPSALEYTYKGPRLTEALSKFTEWKFAFVSGIRSIITLVNKCPLSFSVKPSIQK